MRVLLSLSPSIIMSLFKSWNSRAIKKEAKANLNLKQKIQRKVFACENNLFVRQKSWQLFFRYTLVAIWCKCGTPLVQKDNDEKSLKIAEKKFATDFCSSKNARQSPFVVATIWGPSSQINIIDTSMHTCIKGRQEVAAIVNLFVIFILLSADLLSSKLHEQILTVQ